MATSSVSTTERVVRPGYIDISGLDRVQLLRHLWEKSKVAGFFGMYGGPTPSFGSERRPEDAVSGYIDYFCGRVIKTDLRDDEINPYLYDRDNGKGAFQRVVDTMRSSTKHF
jgi:hypothetical protein